MTIGDFMRKVRIAELKKMAQVEILARGTGACLTALSRPRGDAGRDHALPFYAGFISRTRAKPTTWPELKQNEATGPGRAIHRGPVAPPPALHQRFNLLRASPSAALRAGRRFADSLHFGPKALD